MSNYKTKRKKMGYFAAFRKTLLLSGVMPVLAAFAFSPGQSRADELNGTKSVTWQIKSMPIAGGGAYSWDLLAQAADADPPPNGKKREAGKDKWDVISGLSDPLGDAVTKSAEFGGPKGAEPYAKSTAEFSASNPGVPAGKPGVVTGTIGLHLIATLEPPDGKAQSAYSSALTTLTIAGGAVTGATITRNGQVVPVDTTKIKGGSISFGGNIAGGFADPVSITLADLTTGVSITETLYSNAFSETLGGAWSWDAGGISLLAPRSQSTVSIALDFPSPWITDPSLVDSTVSLANGVFTATGLFAGLPWVVTSTSATLAVNPFDNLTVPYEIPAYLINPGDLYSEVLSDSTSAYLSVAAPEASTWVMMLAGFAALGLARYRRPNAATLAA